MPNSTTKAEYGDFQTPPSLASAVCRLLHSQGVRPASIVEPTCGIGSLVFAGLDQFNDVQAAVGIDINAEHLRCAQAAANRRHDAAKLELIESDFFNGGWNKVLAVLPEPILVLGNPPWVTNAHLGALGSQNLPVKSNFQKHNGLDAKTGKANFDISEWMIVKLVEGMNGRDGTIAMLCKAAVARKVLQHAWKAEVAIERSAMYRIDAQLHFDAAVDAILLVAQFGPKAAIPTAVVHRSLSDLTVENIIGYENGLLLADVGAYRHSKRLCGRNAQQWRSGIKHDCSKVMELRRSGTTYRNGFGEVVDVEDEFLYPMLKSSDLAQGRSATGTRWMIVPQKSVNENTAVLRDAAPKLWAYLTSHAQRLDGRGSSIYRGRPRFSIFGVGDYSFAPWKVAVSGFYKSLRFVPVGPFENRPTVVDDTAYFLSFETQAKAEFVGSLLDSAPAQTYFSAFVFWDSKRPITVDLLRRLDLERLAEELGAQRQFNDLFGAADSAVCPGAHQQLALWG